MNYIEQEISLNIQNQIIRFIKQDFILNPERNYIFKELVENFLIWYSPVCHQKKKLTLYISPVELNVIYKTLYKFCEMVNS